MTLLRARLARTRDLWLVAISAVLLILLALRWMGYDLWSFSQSLIGSHNDRFLSAWTLWQAIDNLLTRPFDLGYASIFSAEQAPFALSIAPYGIALVLLPVYLLSGGSLILTYNLYLTATFPLTALSAYVLIRYLIRPTPLAAGVMALLVAFASFRFWHLEQIDMLSSHLFLLTLYCFHRVLDTPRRSWAALLGLSLWLLAVSSRDMVAFFLISAALISTVALLYYTDDFVQRLPYLIPAGILSGLAAWPLLAWHWASPTFRQGFTRDAISYFSAQPDDWLIGFSALYTHRTLTPGQDVPLFVGAVLLLTALLGVLALIRQGHETALDDLTPRLMSPRSIVYSYAGLAVLGWLLTLGPSITTGADRSLALPYGLITRWPVFSGLRFTGRYLLLTITGLAVLGAYGLRQMLPRIPARWRTAVWAALIAAALIEHVPYAGSMDMPPRIDGQRRLDHDPLPARPELAAWLDSLPADTRFVVYPPDAVSQALFDPVTRGRSLINGQASLLPNWYAEGLTHAGLSRYLIGSYAAFGADYLLFYSAQPSSEGLNWNDIVHTYNTHFEDLRAVGQFDDVQVYALDVEPVYEARYDFDGMAPGLGWYEPLADVSGNGFQWTSESHSTLDFYFVDDSALRLEARIVEAASPEILDSLTLRVNGEPVEMGFHEDADGSRIYEARIPASLLGGQTAMTRFAFGVKGVVDETQADPAQGTYPYGLLFDWVTISPIGE